jgi:hypothetical protein
MKAILTIVAQTYPHILWKKLSQDLRLKFTQKSKAGLISGCTHYLLDAYGVFYIN